MKWQSKLSYRPSISNPGTEGTPYPLDNLNRSSSLQLVKLPHPDLLALLPCVAKTRKVAHAGEKGCLPARAGQILTEGSHKREVGNRLAIHHRKTHQQEPIHRQSRREREAALRQQEVGAVVAEGLAKLVMHESRWRHHHHVAQRRMEEAEISRVSPPPPPGPTMHNSA